MADVEMKESDAPDIDAPGPSQSKSRADQLLDTFVSYRVSLDADNERRERLVILSRSITQQSKKLIFHLHRGATHPDLKARQKNIREARDMREKIIQVFKQISEELKGREPVETYWKWTRNVSGGLEEFIEAISFLHYMEHRELIDIEAVQRALSVQGTEDPLVSVTPEDYILGLSDLTGELMRYATNALGTGDHETPIEICSFVRSIKGYFDGIPIHLSRQLSKKQDETTRSLEKIERLCYSTQLRLVEFSGRADVLAEMAKRDLGGHADHDAPRQQEIEA